ncbi:SPOR domain-containing protein [Thaumasiovibrio subtropicus]|uniref:SPOR domain-containing protein n=1 Tax=Thaumasiovibrio subtropicus TaxID=1891207 RepID=UPI000B35A46F|nr:SPOR domain-containing protein [Thaumasiovibrio subtropicus]
MKKTLLIGAVLVLTGCASSDVTTTVVASEAEIEQYNNAMPMESDPILTLPAEEPMAQVVKPVEENKIVLNKPTKPAMTSGGRYSIQVLALSHDGGFQEYVDRLPSGKPIYVNKKMLNGLPWYTLLYGEYSSKAEAKRALNALPSSVRQYGPFIRSLDDIKRSSSPDLRQLR